VTEQQSPDQATHSTADSTTQHIWALLPGILWVYQPDIKWDIELSTVNAHTVCHTAIGPMSFWHNGI